MTNNLPPEKQRLARMLKALGNPLRFQIVETLAGPLPYLPDEAQPDPANGDLRSNMTRDQFESCVGSIVERTRKPCEDALRIGGIGKADIDEVLLVGGQTRTPMVIRLVQELFGKEPLADIDPERRRFPLLVNVDFVAPEPN